MSRDIEEKFNRCAFHYIRSMIHSYDIILMPYNYIFNENLRSKLKLKIKNNIIVFDEAHHFNHLSEESESISINLDKFSIGLKKVIIKATPNLNLDRIKKTIVVGDKIKVPLKKIYNKIKTMKLTKEPEAAL